MEPKGYSDSRLTGLWSSKYTLHLKCWIHLSPDLLLGGSPLTICPLCLSVWASRMGSCCRWCWGCAQVYLGKLKTVPPEMPTSISSSYGTEKYITALGIDFAELRVISGFCIWHISNQKSCEHTPLYVILAEGCSVLAYFVPCVFPWAFQYQNAALKLQQIGLLINCSESIRSSSCKLVCSFLKS